MGTELMAVITDADMLIYAVIILGIINFGLGVVVVRFFKEAAGKMSKMASDVGCMKIANEGSSQGSGTGSAAADENLMASLKKYDKHFSILASTLSAFQESADKGFRRVDRDMTAIESLVAGMRDYLSESNAQMTRLQEGYDYSVLKRIARPVIQVAGGLEALITRLEGRSEADEIRALWLDLVESLRQNGVERLIIEKNADFANIRKMAEAVTHKQETTDPNKVGKVAQVIRAGYCYVYNNDRKRLILPAQVKLYEKAGV